MAAGLPLGLDTLGTWFGLLTGLATTTVLLLRRYNHPLSRHRSTHPLPAAV
ncbi:hypothetical protein [Streptomyces sp. NPDC001070]